MRVCIHTHAPGENCIQAVCDAASSGVLVFEMQWSPGYLTFSYLIVCFI